MKKKQILKRIWALCVPYRSQIAVVIGFMVVQQLVNATFPLVLGSILTSVTKTNMRMFIVAIGFWIVLTSIRVGLVYLRERFEINRLDYELSRYLSRVSMEKFFSISMGQHHLGHSVIRQSIISKGEASLSGIVNLGIYDLAPAGLMVLIPLGFLLWTAPAVGFSILVTITLFVTFTIKYNLFFVPKLRALDSLTNKVIKKKGEVIQNADIVYVNAQEERVRRECDDENAKQGVEGKPVWQSYIIFFHGGQWLISIAQAASVALSGYLAFKGKITPGTFVAVYMWIGSSLGMVTNLSNIQRNVAKNIAPAVKYFRFLDYEPDILMPERPVPIEYLKGKIEFRHVSFAYCSRKIGDVLNDDLIDDEPSPSGESTDISALKDVSFTLEEGRRYAFVGRSGAGKSTLVGLMLRAFDPQRGHVFIDGVDIRMLDYRELRRHIGLVPQDVDLFDGTMRYNITFGMNGSADKVTDTEIDSVAKLSRVLEFKDKLENGWETVIGERGIKLSGGQRQRVGIARALIKNPQILIFDEATSSLDTENEARIRESITEASQGKTTIIIAHRLATVRDADKIFVFDEGTLVGEGTHTELLQSSDYYQRLVHNQVIMA